MATKGKFRYRLPMDFTFGIMENGVEAENEHDYTVLVIGVTGAGKSSLCIFFFQEKVFNVGSGMFSITEKIIAHAHSLHNKSILFIDTPDTNESEEHMACRVGKSLIYAKNEINAIVICINGAKRFDSAATSLMHELELLGAFWPYAIVVVY